MPRNGAPLLTATAPTKRPPSRVLDLLASEPWAITEDALRQMVAVASRMTLGPEAVEAVTGEPLESTYIATIRDGIATIPITGPVVRYANLFTRVSGMTSLELAARDLARARDDASVQGIILAIDSPGGAVSGTSEFSDLIYQTRSVKPVAAHIDGMGASAAYWIASAADTVSSSNTSLVGSLGVIMFAEPNDPDELVFVSSQSPFKATDPMDELGRSQRQRIVDALAEEFLAAVARNRGVDLDTVRTDFGQGDVFVGQAAEDAGLIDTVTTYEAAFAAMQQQIQERRSARFVVPGYSGAVMGSTMRGGVAAEPQEDGMPKDTSPAAPTTVAELRAQYPDLTAQLVSEADAKATAEHEQALAAARAEGVKAESARLAAIDALLVPGAESVIAACKADTSITAEQAAVKVIQHTQQQATASAAAAREDRAAHLAALQADEAALIPPAPSAGTDPSGTQQEVAAILAVHQRLNPDRRSA